VDAGSGKLTNCSSGSEGGWGCLGFDRNHADNGERVKVAQWIHGSKAREEKWGAGIWCLATRLRRGGSSMVANNTTGAEEAGGSWRLVRRYCLDMGGRRG
jgi:hypothetical protein